MRSIHLRRLTGRLTLLLTLPSGLVIAQQSNPPGAAAGPAVASLPGSAADTLELMLTARSTDSVRSERDRLLSERRDVETRWAVLRDQGIRLRAGIGEVKDALSAAAAREGKAKKEKRDADRIIAASEKERLDRSLILLKARADLREAQAELARIERDFVDASIRADDAELSIAARRDQVSPDDPSQRTAFQELTSRWLQALRTRSARAYDLEDRRFKVVEAQIDMLKRQRA